MTSDNPHADQLKFRAWLVKQLTLTRWSLPLRLSEEEMAEQLGVRIDVLREAQQARDAELKRRGHGGISRGKRRYTGTDHCKLEVKLPKLLRPVWIETCAALGLEPATVLRSLVQQFLLDPVRPLRTSEEWVYQGKIYRVPRKRDCPSAKTSVTRGVQIAMDTHAENWRVTATAIARGLILDFFEGRTKKLKIVTFSELWGDPDRYLHPENFSNSRPP